MKIITGRTGELHVTSDDDRHLHAGTFGEGKYILSTGSKLNASNPSSNVVRLAKGDIIFQGCHARIEDYEDVELEPGTDGYCRIDVICAQYKKVGGVESTEIVVYTGTPAVSNPIQPIPAYASNNILDGAEIADMELYKVFITNVNITKIERLAKINTGLDDIYRKNETYPKSPNLKDSGLLNLIYPVGAIYMSTSGTNPGNLFGGTWVAWGSGRVPVGVNGGDGNFNTVEKTGGQSTVTIAGNNIPTHNHGINDPGHAHSNTLSAPIPGVTGTAGQVAFKAQSTGEAGYVAPASLSNNDIVYYSDLTAASSGTGISTQNAYGNAGGGADAMTNLQPYITCYMWKRTA